MKKTITLFIAFAIVQLSKAQTSPNDFRGFAWGSPLNKVQAGEKAKFVKKEKEDILQYEDQLGKVDCYVMYVFNDNDKLVSGDYIFTRDYPNSQLYVHDYYKFQQLLTDKYGKPRSEKENWANNATVTDKENYGQAVMDGHLSLYATWETERSYIKVSLALIEGKPSVQIHYTYQNLTELDNKDELKKAMSEL